jgi:hypothetical protein
MTRSSLVLIVSLAVVACAAADDDRARESSNGRGSVPAEVDSDAAQGEVGRDSLIVRLYRLGLSFGLTRAEAAAALGPPDSSAVQTEPNRYSATTDSSFQFFYDGLELWFLRAGYDGREFLEDVHLSDSRWELPGGLQIGQTTLASLIAQIGDATYREELGDTVLAQYVAITNDLDAHVRLYFVRDTLRKLRWELRAD